MKERSISGKVALAAVQYSAEGKYWLEKFSGELKKTGFPHIHTESVPGSTPKDTKRTIHFELTGRLFLKLMQIGKGLDHRLYIILTAGLVLLLSKYSGENDIILGSPIYRQDTEGDFINTVLALRNQLENHMTFKEFLLQQVRPTVIEANEHQDYPIETLLYQLNIPFTGNKFPLFDVAILLENIHEKTYLDFTHPNMIFSFKRNDDKLEGELEYNTTLYDDAFAGQIAIHFQSLLEQAVLNLDIPVDRLEILTEQEKKRLLDDFNDTRSNYPSGKTIDELFEEQAIRTPGKHAVTYENKSLTYKELSEESNGLAAFLCTRGACSGKPVPTMVENSTKAIVTILGILKAGGAYMPLNTEYPVERIKYILADCHADIILSNLESAAHFNGFLTVINIEDPAIYLNKKKIGTGHHSRSLAYIMYTSGSTGIPKGVMVEHRSVVRLVKNTDYITFKENDSILLTGALEFDASTFEIWGALLNGLSLYLANKETILSFDRIKKTIKEFGITTMWMTSPLFNQFVDTDIDIFDGFTNLLVGGDVLSPMHINKVRSHFPRLQIINGYGPTENTTFSLTHQVNKKYDENIPIGRPIANSTAYILDNQRRPVPIGATGQLYTGGDGVARGYLNNPEHTHEKFISEPFGPTSTTREAKVYATGDLARWLPDRTVQFMGRLDHQVKIRGYRIEPGEIENQLLRMDYILEATVIDRTDRNGAKYLCAYIVVDEKKMSLLDPREMRKKLSDRLPDYMVPSYFVQLREISLNSNGKIDRNALPEPETGNTGTPFIAPRNPVEEKCAEIWSEILGVEKEKIGIDDDFFELGGHSLKATILISKMHRQFNLKLPLAILFRLPTIRGLAEYMKELTEERFYNIEPDEKKEFYHLSSTQRRMYVLQQMEPASLVYNIPMVLIIEGLLNIAKLEQAFFQLIQRREELRTSFEMIGREPVQRIREKMDFRVEFVDLDSANSRYTLTTDSELRAAIEEFVQPFDLAKAPLFRVKTLREMETQHYLMIDMHHIITDAISMNIFIKEIMKLYEGEILPPVKLHYKDYSQWQQSEKAGEAMKRQQQYWLKQFQGELPLLNLPCDFERPKVQTFEGSTLKYTLTRQHTDALNQLALEERATLYLLLLTVTYVFLSKICNQEDIIIGTPIAARRHADLENMIGMFVNTLALRNFPKNDKTFLSFFREVKHNMLAAFENQEYEFEDLVQRVAVSRDTGRNPLFAVMFEVQNVDMAKIEISGLKLEHRQLENRTAKFDITITGIETRQGYSLVFEYNTALFKIESMKKIIDSYIKVIDIIIKAPNTPIGEIEIISEMEKNELIEKMKGDGVRCLEPVVQKELKINADFDYS